MPKNENDVLREAQRAFGATLEHLLERDDLSQPALARAVSKGKYEVSAKTVNNIVNGRHPTELVNLATIAAHFGVPLWVMFIPDLPADVLDKAKLARLEHLVKDYLACEDAQRRHAENMAAGYAGLTRET